MTHRFVYLDFTLVKSLFLFETLAKVRGGNGVGAGFVVGHVDAHKVTLFALYVVDAFVNVALYTGIFHGTLPPKNVFTVIWSPDIEHIWWENEENKKTAQTFQPTPIPV